MQVASSESYEKVSLNSSNSLSLDLEGLIDHSQKPEIITPKINKAVEIP